MFKYGITLLWSLLWGSGTLNGANRFYSFYLFFKLLLFPILTFELLRFSKCTNSCFCKQILKSGEIGLFNFFCFKFLKTSFFSRRERENISGPNENDDVFKNGLLPASFSLFSSFLYSWQKTNVLYKSLLMATFKLQTSGVGSDRSTNWVTTTAHNCCWNWKSLLPFGDLSTGSHVKL